MKNRPKKRLHFRGYLEEGDEAKRYKTPEKAHHSENGQNHEVCDSNYNHELEPIDMILRFSFHESLKNV